MPVKFNQYWTIIPELNDEYEKFIMNEYIPEMNNLGIHIVAAWNVMVGAYSDIIFEGVCSDLELLERALIDKKYKKLKANLFNFIKYYKTKVLVATEKVGNYTIDIRENTIKFIQMWNILSDKLHEYGRFTLEEYYPLMEELGIVVAQEWEVLIGDGPSILCEGRAQDPATLINNLQGKKFRQAKHQLKNYITNYSSRLLSFHIQKVKGYRSVSYNLIQG
ncbi:MAG: hypothetical protein JW864_10605 [Spirochaetes bacterium]|nr:hypothetical protein [Spirochaetota bacterium]